MIYTAQEYGKIFYNGLSGKSIIRRIKKGFINQNHKAYKKGRVWLIEVPTDYEIKISK